MFKRTRALAIKPEVKKKVEERDHHQCIFCGRPGRGEAHVISRAHGGLGVEQNLVTVCRECHFGMDDTVSRSFFLELAEQHLRSFYPDLTPDAVTYKKGIKTKPLGSWSNKNLVNNTNAYIENSVKRKETKHEGFWLIEKGDQDEGIIKNGQGDDPADIQ